MDLYVEMIDKYLPLIVFQRDNITSAMVGHFNAKEGDQDMIQIQTSLYLYPLTYGLRNVFSYENLLNIVYNEKPVEFSYIKRIEGIDDEQLEYLKFLYHIGEK